MKHIIFGICFIGMSVSARSQYNNYLPGGINLCENGAWEVVFEDDFNGTSLDLTKWVTYVEAPDGSDVSSYSRDFDGNNRSNWYSDNNIWIQNGKCKIKLLYEPTTIVPCSGCAPVSNDFTSSMIKTKAPQFGGQLFLRGRFEARVKMAAAPASHTTIWTWSANGNEVDFGEYFGNAPTEMPVIFHNWHAYDDCTPPNTLHRWSDDQPRFRYNDPTTMNWINWSQDFYTYILEWDLNFMRVYIYSPNNVLFYSKEIPRFVYYHPVLGQWIDFAACTTLPGTYFENPVFFDNNDGVDFRIQLDVDANGLTQQELDNYGVHVMEIDYVKIYKRNECSEDMNVTNSRLFDIEELNERRITLGTQGAPNSWKTYVPRWRHIYEAESITMLPNFEALPVFHDASCPYNGDDYWFASHQLYMAKECSEMPKQIPRHSEIDTLEPIRDTFNCSMIDSSFISQVFETGDSAMIASLFYLMDSLGCDSLSGQESQGRYSSSTPNYRKAPALSKYKTLDRPMVYPNPNNGSFTIVLPPLAECDVSIFNAVGIEVHRSKIKNEIRTTIKLDDSLPPGTYTIRIEGPNINHIEKLTIIK